MQKKGKVLLGMSGGVDSSVSAILLKEQGYQVVGVTMDLFHTEGSSNNIKDAKKVCDSLGIEHYAVNYEKEFKKYVIDDFCKAYASCKTPNPCIECNKHLKFGILFDKMKELDCDYLATGHYSLSEYNEKYKRYVIKRSLSVKKDQSYVLWKLSKDIIPKLLFPLGIFENKEKIREIAKENNIAVANKPDSEDICFIPDGNYKSFLENNGNFTQEPGDIVDISGKVLGRHKGLYYYTIGQRKGLGIANDFPLFVIEFDKEKNQVIVGENKDLFKTHLEVKDYNLQAIDVIDNFLDAKIKVRYGAREAKGKITYKDIDTLAIDFDEPQRAITSGQSAVFYVDDVLIGGGVIV